MENAYHFEEYNQVIKSLENLTSNLYAAFSVDENPAVVLAKTGEIGRLRYVLSQYCHLPGNIVKILTSAKDIFTFEKWPTVSNMLEKNIADENGFGRDGSKDDPHYDRLMNGLIADFGMDLRDASPQRATSKFIDIMLGLFRRGEDPYEVAGRIYALEYTAEPEISVVQVLLNHAHIIMKGVPLPQGPTRAFLEDHVKEYEPRHEEELREAFCAYIVNAHSRQAFFRGFKTVADLMEDWWKAMVEESNSESALQS